MIKWAMIFGAAYRIFDTEREALEHLIRLENLTGRKGKIQKIKVG